MTPDPTLVPCANCRKPCPPYAGDAGTLCRDCLIALRERLAAEHVHQAASGAAPRPFPDGQQVEREAV